MAFDTRELEKGLQGAGDWLVNEYAGIRTGRATPAILDSIQIESYGTLMSLQQLGSVGVEDARTIRVALWDKSQQKAIEKAITDANLGLSVVGDDRGLRVVFPELTAERRVQLLKLAKQKLEDARVSVRKVRDDAIKSLEAAEKSGGMGEDEKFRTKETIQKKVDEMNAKLEDLYKKKEAEIGA